MKKIYKVPQNEDNLEEYVKDNIEKINEIIHRLFPETLKFPNAKELKLLRIKHNLSGVFEDIIERNKKGHNFYSFRVPESEGLKEEEIEFLQGKGYNVYVKVKEDYYCKILWS